MVPVDESEVYETVLPMCGPDHHLNQPSGESRADGDGLHRWLSRLSAPGLSDWIAPVVERVSRASRRT